MISSILPKLSNDLLIPQETLFYLVKTSPYRYKKYSVPKRNGKGQRRLAQPAKEVKALQYWVIDNVLKGLPLHACSTAYSPGCSISNNAKLHKENSYLVKMDFKNFFPSLTDNDFLYYARHSKKLQYSLVDIALLNSIMFWSPKRDNELELAIGAPSSPLLSNLLLYDFDVKVDDFCRLNSITYSRYADDLTFSTNRQNKQYMIVDFVTSLLDKIKSPSLIVNENKTVFASRGSHRRITGIVITNEGEISLGKERRKDIRAKAFLYQKFGANQEEAAKLQGLLAFAKDVEPGFVCKLLKKYDKISKLV